MDRTTDDRTSDRRRRVALAGHQGDAATARAALQDPDPKVRETALGALLRAEALEAHQVTTALADPDPGVRRRALTVGCHFSGDTEPDLVPLLSDPDDTVCETAAWALGEQDPPNPAAAAALAEVVRHHQDRLCREAAVAALGAIGDPASLETILAATTDVATVRRRAIIALAPYDGPEVEAAFSRAREDRDWQVRQAAEDLIAE